MDVDGDGRTAGLLLGDLLDLNGELKSVDLTDLALTVLVRTTDNLDLVLLADGEGADTVLLAQSGGEGSRQQNTSDMGRGSEVSLSGLAARARDVYNKMS